MKKILFLLVVTSVSAYAYNDELADGLREANGKIEELQKQQEAMRKEIAELRKAIGNGAEKANDKPIEYKDNGEKISDAEAKAFIKKVSEMIETGSLDDAEKNLDDFIEKSLNKLYMGQACFYKGKVLYSRKKHGEAMKYFIRSAQLNPRGCKAPSAVYLLANCLIILKKEKPKEKEKLQDMLKQTLQSLQEMGKAADAKVKQNTGLLEEEYYIDAIKYGKWASGKL